ncbi:MAG: RNA 2',3'-cyclic phosphodiesterase [Chloroflexota bacterium]|nr:RNA 2',3'-cyclic phosphodiesterase [Chloroflexota bacterium]
MRLFFAIELPARVRKALGQLRPAHSGAYRWVDPALLHVTLAFLGQQPDERLETLERVGAAAASESHTTLLKLGQRGSFGPRKEPRVLWVGIDGDVAALLALQARLATGLRQAGFELEDRAFSPHVTLARRREGAESVGPPAWPAALPAESETFTLDHLTLVESRLSSRGPTYIPLLEFPFQRGV